MKLILLIVSLGLNWGCSRSELADPAPLSVASIDWKALERAQDGRFLHQGSPFNGVAVSEYEDGSKRVEAQFKDGRLHGSYSRWHKDGWRRMEMHFAQGVSDGEWTQWQANGLVEKIEVWHMGKLVETRYSEHITEAVELKEERRAELNNSIYAEEETAQIHEQTFVALWDDIRAAEDKWVPLERFQMSGLIPGMRGEMTELDWDIKRTEWIRGGQSLTLRDWRSRLASLRKRGIELAETEWHQEKFESEATGGLPRSEFKFLLHVRDKAVEQRFVVRGNISVTWTGKRDPMGRPVPGQVEVLNATIWQRKGSPAFTYWHHLDPWKHAPLEQRKVLAPLLVYDLNRDGLSEVIFAGSNLVYWNRGGGNFEKGILCNHPLPGLTGAVVADFSGDGQADLLACFKGQPPALFAGDVQGRFSDPPKQILSIPPTKTSYAITAGDIDADGDLDVYLTQYKFAYELGHMPTPFYDANDGNPAYLLVNEGGGIFADATAKAGLDSKRHRRTYSSSLVDLDDDSDLDLVVVSDFAGLDYYLNNGQGQFSDVTSRLGDHRFSFGMSHVLGDFNSDGNMDLYMVGMGSTTARRLEAMGANREDSQKVDAHRMKLGYGNRLLLGDGKGGMTQSPHNHLVARTGWGWGSTASDFDNDGDEDIYVGNGNISGETAQDYCTHFWRHDIFEGDSQPDISQGLLFDRKMACLDTISWNGFEHNVLLMNDGTGVFSSVGWLMDVAHEFDSYSVVSDDLDADGRPDLLVIRADRNIKPGKDQLGNDEQRGGESLLLQRNQWPKKGKWIGVRLHEYGRGFSPIGARIFVQHPDGVLSRQVFVGDSIIAQHSNHKHFGLGSIDRVDAIEVRWPNGQVSELKKPAIDQYHTIAPPKREASKP